MRDKVHAEHRFRFAGHDAEPAGDVGRKMHRRVATKALDPVTVNALALEDAKSGGSAVLVSCDLVSSSDRLLRAVRDLLAARAPAVPADRLILAATHTHTSFVFEEGSTITPAAR